MTNQVAQTAPVDNSQVAFAIPLWLIFILKEIILPASIGLVTGVASAQINESLKSGEFIKAMSEDGRNKLTEQANRMNKLVDSAREAEAKGSTAEAKAIRQSISTLMKEMAQTIQNDAGNINMNNPKMGELAGKVVSALQGNSEKVLDMNSPIGKFFPQSLKAQGVEGNQPQVASTTQPLQAETQADGKSDPTKEEKNQKLIDALKSKAAELLRETGLNALNPTDLTKLIELYQQQQNRNGLQPTSGGAVR
jgi:hypothetical protein